MDTIKAGMFKVTSGEVCVNDPCYTEDLEKIKARNGEWTAYANRGLAGKDDERVFAFICVHGKNPDALRKALAGEFPHRDAMTVKDVARSVDSGQLGVFDTKVYPVGSTKARDKWYDRVCDITASGTCGTVDGKGFVTESGFGDSVYQVQVSCDKDGNAVAILGVFIEEADEEKQT